MTTRDESGRVRSYNAYLFPSDYLDVAHLLPRIGDSFYLVLLDVSIDREEAVSKPRCDDDTLTNSLVVKPHRHTVLDPGERVHMYAFNVPLDPKAKDPGTRYKLTAFNPFLTKDGSLETDIRQILIEGFFVFKSTYF